ncbi:MarR family transcriptional regulator [Streptomyces sp. NPDC059009]|uniref:MarR family transcriptional regulator n=1 Tax=Streptomyces sp. NPDC059009 TaxID=3346694 RepID=UPI00369BF13C
MTDVRGLVDPAGYGTLARALAECASTAATARIRVTGRPGGVFHLREGRVIGVDSPGAPGLEALLLRSGRVGETEWAAALAGRDTDRGADLGPNPGPEAGLVARGHMGAAELRVLSMMARHDAAFAVTAGELTECTTDLGTDGTLPLGAASDGSTDAPGDHRADTPHNRLSDARHDLLTAARCGDEPARLLRETRRRLAALAAFPHPVRPDRDRMVPATDQLPPPSLPAVRREILSLCDGRRTPRDIAFATGRALYSVTVETARMLAERLLVRASRDAPPPWPRERAPLPALSRRGPGDPGGPASPASPAGQAPPAPGAERDRLPRRAPGASGFTGAPTERPPRTPAHRRQGSPANGP